ncbi:MAG: sugar ABC transporter permease [Candidatus Faecousia sp.]|nr:sugar ABC transporter permease [Candidatus Faecousia sp.]
MKKRKNYRAFLSSFAFIFPAILVVGVLLLYPVVTSVFYSFTSKHLIKASYKWVWLDNYKKVLSDPEFLSAFLTSIKWTVCSLLGQILVGFTAALALERVKSGKGVYRTLLIIPWAFPSIVIALSWKWILNGVYGFVPNLLVKLGICQTIPQFFSSAGMVFGTLVFINIWFGAPLIMVNVLSALQTVPKDQYEAAQIDGASPWQSFIHITLPHIRVVVGLLVVLRTIWVFNNFDTIYLITGGGPANLTMTVPIYAYNVGWGLKQLGVSSAVTVLLLIFLLLICRVYFHILDKWEREGA